MQAMPVEESDDEDAAHVIEDGQRRDEDDEGPRNTSLEQREAPDAEGDVGGHGNGPSLGALAARAEEEINARGEGHSSDRRNGGQQRLGGAVQLSDDKLSLYLHPHDEEEDGHEAVVDELRQREAGLDFSEPQHEWALQEGRVGVRPWRVGPDECGDGGREQQDAAGCLRPQEFAQRINDCREDGWKSRRRLAHGPCRLTNGRGGRGLRMSRRQYARCFQSVLPWRRQEGTGLPQESRAHQSHQP
jgi:hypothetical protein